MKHLTPNTRRAFPYQLQVTFRLPRYPHTREMLYGFRTEGEQLAFLAGLLEAAQECTVYARTRHGFVRSEDAWRYTRTWATGRETRNGTHLSKDRNHLFFPEGTGSHTRYTFGIQDQGCS